MRGAPPHIIPIIIYSPLNFSTFVKFSSYKGYGEDAKFPPQKAFVWINTRHLDLYFKLFDYFGILKVLLTIENPT